MDADLRKDLLLSIEGNRLIVLCGAGLSMAEPSAVPSAKALSRKCWDKYLEIVGSSLSESFKDDLGILAGYFVQNKNFISVFISLLVPWGEFNSDYNKGHEAIADFLASDIIEYAVTSNFDPLIENAALQLGGKDFDSSIYPDDTYGGTEPYKPLHKINGCCRKDRAETIWCIDQLDQNSIKDRIDRYKSWLSGRLSGNDVIIVGFWSDWSYLNNVLFNCVSRIEPNKVILVDPANASELSHKAPELWSWAHSGKVQFNHVQEEGQEFLDELRRIISCNIIRRLMEASKDLFKSKTGHDFAQPILLDDLISDDLYSMRRDVEGILNNQIVRSKKHQREHGLIGFYSLLLIEKGAVLSGPFYKFKGKIIRLLHAAGQHISAVKSRFSKEKPRHKEIITVCVGAIDDAAAALNIVKPKSSATIVRSGLVGQWVNHEYLDVLTEEKR